MLSGDNGILQRTTDAKKNTEKVQIIETAQMDILGVQAKNHGNLSEDELEEILTSSNYNTRGTLSDNGEESVLKKTLTSSDGKYQILVSEIYNGSFTIANLEEETLLGPNGKPLINQTTVAEITEEKIIGEDALGNQVMIPEGFKLAQGANGSGETVKEGIVIEDSVGNQYVWVPVSNINHDGSNKIKVDSAEEEGVEITLGRYTFATSSPGNPTLAEGSYQYASSYATPVTIDEYCQELTTYRQSNGLSNTTATNTTAKNLQGFIESVRDNKGYYIARYEASYRTNGKVGSIVSTSSAEALASSSSAPETRTAGDLWNFIKQGEAAAACQDLYKISETKVTVNSDLMNSYAWDTAIIYIQAMGNTNYANANKNGRTGTSLMNTGTTGDEKCKIFDIAENTREWTTEYSSETNKYGARPCVGRGGYTKISASAERIRGIYYATQGYFNFSFRPVIYL